MVAGCWQAIGERLCDRQGAVASDTHMHIGMCTHIHDIHEHEHLPKYMLLMCMRTRVHVHMCMHILWYHKHARMRVRRGL